MQLGTEQWSPVQSTPYGPSRASYGSWITMVAGARVDDGR